MRHARIRFHGAVQDFLAPAARSASVVVPFELPTGLRDLVQSVGVPHVEVSRVTVNGEEAPWERLVDGGDEIDVEPRFPLDRPPVDPRFILDVHLGRLAKHLRLLGFDAVHDPTLDDPELARRSVSEGRILLTRDLGLLKRSEVESGSFVRAVGPRDQIVEVMRRFALRRLIVPFGRCLECNGELVATDPSEISGAVPDGITQRYESFRRCAGCRRVYWEGSHHRRMSAFAEGVIAEI